MQNFLSSLAFVKFVNNLMSVLSIFVFSTFIKFHTRAGRQLKTSFIVPNLPYQFYNSGWSTHVKPAPPTFAYLLPVQKQCCESDPAAWKPSFKYKM